MRQCGGRSLVRTLAYAAVTQLRSFSLSLLASSARRRRRTPLQSLEEV